jgi:hypothetical protein
VASPNLGFTRVPAKLDEPTKLELSSRRSDPAHSRFFDLDQETRPLSLSNWHIISSCFQRGGSKAASEQAQPRNEVT